MIYGNVQGRIHRLKVSAIITTHNRLPLLKRAIDSVFGQTYQNIECIVVSDNSVDGTVDYCRHLDGIHFIDIPASESKGGNYARNLGIKAAKGEFIAFLDDDDYWLPDKIERQMEVVQKMNCGFVYCGRKLEIVSSNGTVTFQDELPDIKNRGNMSKRVLYEICTTTSSILVSKDILNAVGLFDETLRFWQEYELCIRLAQITNFYFVPNTLIVYRVDVSDKGRLTNKYYEWWDAVDYIRKKHCKLYSKLSLFERRKSMLLVYKDAYGRAMNSGLEAEGKRIFKKVKLLSSPEIIRDKIKKLHNNYVP